MSKLSATFAVWLCFFVNMALAANTKQDAATATAASGGSNDAAVAAGNAGVITRRQAAIWIPIILAIISVAAVYALYAIDDVKSRDTILYAKFLANLKDR